MDRRRLAAGRRRRPVGTDPRSDRAHGQRHGRPLSDRFDGASLGSQWAFFAPSADEHDRVQLDESTLRLVGKGAGPADSSPLAVLAGDHAYEVAVTVEPAGGAQGGLLLFFNDALFLGMGYDGRTMTTYNGGRRSHWQEPAPSAPVLHLRIANDRHIVTFFYRVDGATWTRHELRFETSGYHANTAGQLLSLRPAIFSAGEGAVAFQDFQYRALP
jgi:xylan 1,4-beta-xylosidase